MGLTPSIVPAAAASAKASFARAAAGTHFSDEQFQHAEACVVGSRKSDQSKGSPRGLGWLRRIPARQGTFCLRYGVAVGGLQPKRLTLPALMRPLRSKLPIIMTRHPVGVSPMEDTVHHSLLTRPLCGRANRLFPTGPCMPEGKLRTIFRHTGVFVVGPQNPV